MPRERIAMSAEEIAAFLAAKRTAMLGLRGADGAPDGAPATISYRDGVLVVELPADGEVARDVLGDPRIVVSVEEYPSYARIRGVAVHGRAVSIGAAEGRERFRVDQPRIESFDFAKMKRTPAE
ncbi:MAG TPA: pyridoxamine 5'-phosphate oxidase family protein [Candidatus Nitrosopolaris sp.]|nr:pyridoxamine 5'-phosphate oxidase family protein [Candidatus Nitrosopolaris sp.]